MGRYVGWGIAAGIAVAALASVFAASLWLLLGVYGLGFCVASWLAEG